MSRDVNGSGILAARLRRARATRSPVKCSHSPAESDATYRGRADDAPIRWFHDRRRVERPLPLSARPRRDRVVGRTFACRPSSATTRCDAGPRWSGMASRSIRSTTSNNSLIPLDAVTVSMTINAPAAICSFVPPSRGGAGSRGRNWRHGAERRAQGVRGARHLHLAHTRCGSSPMCGVCADVPAWNTISISGYHIREAGSTALQEIAFTLANAKAYVQAAVRSGLAVDDVAPRISFFFNAHNDFFEEVAKFRAARTLWAQIVRDEFGSSDPRSQMLRFHTQTGGSTLTAQEPENNVVRVTVQALAAVLGGTQSLHTNGADEALGLPTANAARVALRTQQIIAYEAALPIVDPLAGSYYVESLTDAMVERARSSMIDAMGGSVAAIENGRMGADRRFRLPCRPSSAATARSSRSIGSPTPLECPISGAQNRSGDQWRSNRGCVRSCSARRRQVRRAWREAARRGRRRFQRRSRARRSGRRARRSANRQRAAERSNPSRANGA